MWQLRWTITHTSLCSQTLVDDMEDNEDVGPDPETDNNNNMESNARQDSDNNVESNDQQDSDNKNGCLETIKTAAQIICGMILKLGVCFGIIAVICVITGVSVTQVRP